MARLSFSLVCIGWHILVFFVLVCWILAISISPIQHCSFQFPDQVMSGFQVKKMALIYQEVDISNWLFFAHRYFTWHWCTSYVVLLSGLETIGVHEELQRCIIVSMPVASDSKQESPGFPLRLCTLLSFEFLQHMLQNAAVSWKLLLVA